MKNKLAGRTFGGGGDPPVVPAPQENFADAAAKALEAVRRQSPEQLEWLGASRAGDRWALAVLESRLGVELETGAVTTPDGRAAGRWWRILTLHYLAIASRPADEPPAVTFAALAAGRAYAPVYQHRVIGRLCGTVGRRRQSLCPAAKAIGGKDAEAGDAAWDFQVFPRVRLRLVWYAGDDEFAPSAALLLPGNVESFFHVEDIVVLSERLVSRLAGGSF